MAQRVNADGSVEVGRAWFDGRVPLRRVQLAMALLVLNIVDVLLTRAVLDRGGVEANPLMDGLMTGFAAPLGLKSAVAVVAGALLLACPVPSRRAEVAVSAVVGLYLAIALWNLVILVLLVVA